MRIALSLQRWVSVAQIAEAAEKGQEVEETVDIDGNRDAMPPSPLYVYHEVPSHVSPRPSAWLPLQSVHAIRLDPADDRANAFRRTVRTYKRHERDKDVNARHVTQMHTYELDRCEINRLCVR